MNINSLPAYGTFYPNCKTMFGRPMPKSIVHTQSWVDPVDYGEWLGWKHDNGNTGKIFIEYPLTEQHVDAIIAAMNLSY